MVDIVIKIPDKFYEIIKLNEYEAYQGCLWDIIRDGIPIPKGHGRLIDADALETEMVNGIHAGNYEEGYEEYEHINDMDDCVDCVKYADTIIEADNTEMDV